MAIGDVYELTIGGIQNGQDYTQNNFHFQFVGGTEYPDDIHNAEDLLNGWHTTLHTDYLNLCAQDAFINVLQAKKVTPPGGASAYRFTADSGNFTGNSFSGAVAADVAIGPGGAANRMGRIYFGFLVAASWSSDSWQSSYITPLNTFMNALVGTTIPGLHMSWQYGTYTKGPNTFKAATSWFLRDKISGFNKRTVPVV